MRNSNISNRVKASVLSLVMAATAIPSFTAGMAATALFTPDLSSTENKGAVASLSKDDSYRGKTAPLATSGIKTITFTCVSDFTGRFSYGFGIGIEATPYWMEWNGSTWSTEGKGTEINVTAGKEFTVTLDVSSLTLNYNAATSQYAGEFEFRNYSAGTVSISAVKANDTTGPVVNPGGDDIVRNNKQSGDWSFKDNGNGTATISSTVSKQIEGLDYTLTTGYDEEYYDLHPDELTEDSPINSHKFTYADFGITDSDGVTIESITAIIESEDEYDTFMYGGGLNVKQGSAADTEYAKVVAKVKESGSYWYNDMGAEEVAAFEKAGVEFGVTPGNGVTINGAGTYIEAYWEVPAEVQPHVNVKPTDAISFQFWYGTLLNADDTATDQPTNLTAKLTGIAITYTKEVTVPYTGSVKTAVNAALSLVDDGIGANALNVPYADLGIDEDKEVYAVRFDITASSDIEKLVYSPATSITDADAGYWFQEDSDYVVLNAGKSAEVMWIMPSSVSGYATDLNNLVNKDGNIYFGYYYGAAGSITITNVEVYYKTPETTTTTTTTTTIATTTTTVATTTTTPAPTTTTPAATTTTTAATTTTAVTTTTAPLEVTLWGDANVDGDVDMGDAVAILKYLADPVGCALTEQGKLNGDVHRNGNKLDSSDALSIQKLRAKQLAELPESYLEK